MSLDSYNLVSSEEPYLLSTNVSVFGDSSDPVDFLYGGSSALPDSSVNPEDFAALPKALFDEGVVKPGQPFRVINPQTKKMTVAIARHAQSEDSKTGLDLAPHTYLELGGSKDGKYLVDFRPVKGYPVAQYNAPQDSSARPDFEGATFNVTTLTPDTTGTSLASLSTASNDLGSPTEPQGAKYAQNIDTNEPAPAPDSSGMKKNTDGTVTDVHTGITYNFGDMTYESAHVIPGTKDKGEIITYSLKDGRRMGSRPLSTDKLSKDPNEALIDKKLIDMGHDPIGMTREEKGAMLHDQSEDAQAQDIAQAIYDGRQSPVLTGIRSKQLAVRSKLEKMGYNHAEAVTDWNALQKQVSSLNSTQMIKIRSSAQTAHDSLDLIDEFASDWKANAGTTILNKANLIAAKNNPIHTVETDRLRSIANELEGQIANVTSEIATVNQGGGVPSIPALTLASKELNADWDESVLHNMTDLARRNLKIRLNSLKTLKPAGTSKEEPSLNQSESSADKATVQKDQFIIGKQYRDKNGKVKTYKGNGIWE